MLIPFVDLSSQVAQEPISQSLILKSNDNVPVNKKSIFPLPEIFNLQARDLEFMMRIA